MKHIALFLIVLYQKFISPRKGFRCAYRAHTGRASCSALAHRRYSPVPRILHRQAGYCDVPCDIPCHMSCDASPCDGGHHNIGSTACDFLSGCDCSGCDWKSRKKDPEDDQWVHIPPKVK